MTMEATLGCDLSLAAAGFVAVPLDWDGDWERIARHHVGHSLPNDASVMRKIGRLHQITAEGIAFAQRHGCTKAVIENYGFGAKYSREALGEIGGVVKLALVAQAGIESIEVITADTARKITIGYAPRGADAKGQVQEVLRQHGFPPVWTDDEMDAFVAVNAWRHLRGLYAIHTPEVVRKRKTRRRTGTPATGQPLNLGSGKAMPCMR